MALIKCEECGGEVSSAAKACPKCGAAPPKQRGFLFWAGIGIAAIIGASLFFSGSGQAPKPSGSAADEVNPYDKKAAEEATGPSKALSNAIAKSGGGSDARENAYQRARLLAAAVRQAANDPGSIEISDAFYMNDGTVGLEYRGKNAFGALIKNRAVLTADGKVANGADASVAPLWNKYIAKKDAFQLPLSGL